MAGFVMAKREVVEVRGISMPFVLLLTSNIALPWGVVLLIPTDWAIAQIAEKLIVNSKHIFFISRIQLCSEFLFFKAIISIFSSVIIFFISSICCC